MKGPLFDIPDYPNYKVGLTNGLTGQPVVYSFKNGVFKKKLNPFQDTNGYMRVYLYKNKKGKNIKLHRLAGMLFVPGYDLENKYQINHKNMLKKDNYIDINNPVNSNLEWVSAKENISEYAKTGHHRKISSIGGINRKARLTFRQRTEISKDNTTLIFESRRAAVRHIQEAENTTTNLWFQVQNVMRNRKYQKTLRGWTIKNL